MPVVEFVCKRDCFGNKENGRCRVLKVPIANDDGTCPFQKPKQEVTKGKFYPHRAFDNVVEADVPVEKVKRPPSEFAEEWDAVRNFILEAAQDGR